MKTFGIGNIEWRDGAGVTHVIVATSPSSWDFLCVADPGRYETVEATPKPTSDPVVWTHDRAKVGCDGCLAVLDRMEITFVRVNL